MIVRIVMRMGRRVALSLSTTDSKIINKIRNEAVLRLARAVYFINGRVSCIWSAKLCDDQCTRAGHLAHGTIERAYAYAYTSNGFTQQQQAYVYRLDVFINDVY